MRVSTASAFFGAGLVAAGMLILPPAMFGDRTQGLAQRVYDFQTLIAGLIAVFAAAWTVRAMEGSDRAQERRHNHTVALNLRNEYAAMERLVTAYFEEIRATTFLVTDLALAFSLAPHEAKLVMARAYEVEKAICGTEKILNSREFEQAFEYLDGSLTRAVGEVKAISAQGTTAASRIANQKRYGQEREEDFAFWFVDDAYGSGVEQIVYCLTKLDQNYPALNRGMEELKRRIEKLRILYPDIM
ncbi:hypothetical protein [Rhizobium halophytocola]|uniref:Uncharacterized protein n=1 Tax=Rhizobium halophytocola TaxID=735519 RepID=A0ABS4E432_9HYPH|nr:hypothetical protein [Rhizobium halophytocola]MBP1852708.1 hypothetical protein [Rhizobium halophytocola]